MTVLAVISIPLAGAAIGFVAGLWAGVREGGDINLAPAIYAPIGGLIGGAVGLVIAAVVVSL